MTTDVTTLEKRALELMKQADFGPEAVRVNAEILERVTERSNAASEERLKTGHAVGGVSIV